MLLIGKTIPLEIPSSIDLIKIFHGCPVIYISLFFMSFASLIIWLYSMMTLRLSSMMPDSFMLEIRKLLKDQRFDAALAKCRQTNNFIAGIISAGVMVRKHGPQVMIEIMQSEGKRCANLLWQRISLLNEIAVIAPMLGLLGTVIGLFFAFYDTNRSQESVNVLFDGLGIATGTTVAGLIVAIMAMVFYTILKFRIIYLLSTIEYAALSLVNVIEP